MIHNFIKCFGLLVLVLLTGCGGGEESPAKIVLVAQDASADSSSTLDNTTGSGSASSSNTNDQSANTGQVATDAGDTSGPEIVTNVTPGINSDGGIDTGTGGYPAGSLASVVEAQGSLGMALDALRVAGLDLALNDPKNQWTVFLPTDTAMAASPVFDAQKHIHTTAAIPAIELTLYGDQPLLMNDGGSLFFRDGYEQSVTIAGSAVAGSELFGNSSTSIVHVIDKVIGQNTTPEYEYPVGSLADALVRAGNMTKVLAALRADGLDDALDKASNDWTWFLPNDNGLGSPDDIDLIAHIHKPTVLDSQALTGLTGSTIILKGGYEFEIGGGGAEPLTIGGYTIVQPDVKGVTSAAVVHIIDGVLVPQ